MATLPPMPPTTPKPACGCVTCDVRHGLDVDPSCSCCERQRAEDDLVRKLRGAAAGDLLQTAYALTHRIHVSERGRRPDPRLAARLRAQRDLVTAELVSRCAR